MPPLENKPYCSLAIAATANFVNDAPLSTSIVPTFTWGLVRSNFSFATAYSLIYHGAHNWTRTNDLFLTKEVLYRLSYVGCTYKPEHYCEQANFFILVGAGDGNRTHAISLEG